MSNSQIVRQAGRTTSLLGESPFWHRAEKALYYCDIDGRRLNRFMPGDGAESSWAFDSEPGCCVAIEGGGILLARRDGIHRFDPHTGCSTLVVDAPTPDASIERFNDGKCDALGRLWCGTVHERKQPLAALYCLERGRLERRESGVTTSNGLAWSPDGRTMYWADTPAHTIYAFDFDVVSGRLGERRVFKRFALRDPAASLDDYAGRPDGAAVDVEGNYWVAMYEGSRVLQLSPGGSVLREVMVPARCPTMPCFGGDDLKTLYVTTASHKRPDAELASLPLSGCLLQFEVDVPGLPCHAYVD
jgi:sugar lactone lactonase YvrE